MSHQEYRVADVDDAIDLAARFKAQGKYNWFRGQVKPWPPYSSALRIKLKGDNDFAEAIQAPLLRFVKWLQNTPGMEFLVSDVDGVFAVAQHYGLATDYIDFTTEPAIAGFFACDTKSPEPGSDSCIYCIDTSDLASVWNLIRDVTKGTPDEAPAIELIECTVPNLWRLEAQRGVFLYCVTNWDVHYPMDRILFPYSCYPASPTRADIYPQRKSHLEILLDQYFMNEKILQGNKETREFFDSLQNVNTSWFAFPSLPNHTNPEYFHGGSVSPLPCWSTNQLAPWLIVRGETVESSNGPSIRIAVDSQTANPNQKKALVRGFERVLQERATLRTTSVNWLFNDPRKSSYTPDADLLQALDWIWDGMRSLPYNDIQIAQALAACFTLYQAGLRFQSTDGEALSIAEEIFEQKMMRLEFGAPDGSYSRGFAAVADLNATIRPDMKDLILPDYVEEFASDCRSLFRIIHAPDRTFDYQLLTDIFAQQLVPTQALRRNGSAIFFSPARLDSLGLP